MIRSAKGTPRRQPTRRRLVAAVASAGAVVATSVGTSAGSAGAEERTALGYGCNLILWSAHTSGNTPSSGLKRVKSMHEQESFSPALGVCSGLVCNTAGGGAVIYANGSYGFRHETATHSGCGLWRKVAQPWNGTVDPMSATYRLKWRSDSTQQNWWTRDLRGL